MGGERKAAAELSRLRNDAAKAVQAEVAEQLRAAAAATERAEVRERQAKLAQHQAEMAQHKAQMQATQLASDMDLAGAKMANVMQVLGGLPPTMNPVAAFSMDAPSDGQQIGLH